MADKSAKTVRIGLFSRIDYCSDGFRRGLLDLSFETFKTDDVAFVVALGGLVSGRAHAAKNKKYKAELKIASKDLKILEDALTDCEIEIESLEDKDSRSAREETRLADLRVELRELPKQVAEQKKIVDAIEEKLEALTPEKMAEALAEIMPRFTNAKGKPIKLYIVPSTPYDKDVGIRTADLLAKLRGNDEIRVLTTDGDRLPLWEKTPQMKILELLTLDKQAWLRGDYDSTAVQRRLKDKRRQTSSRRRADIQVVGGVGVSILKPEGQWPQGFIAVPVCHKIEETTTAERQVGVQVMEVHCDRRNVTMRSYSFRDLISRDRTFIGVPADLSPARQTCIDLLKAEGRQTTGSLCDATKLSRDASLRKVSGIPASAAQPSAAVIPGMT